MMPRVHCGPHRHGTPVRRTLRLHTTAALAVLITTLSAACAERPAPPPAPHAWITTADGSSLMSPLPVTTAGSPASAAPAITVDSDQTMQVMDGFGAALTHSSAQVLLAMPADQRAAAMRELFAPDGPVRLTVLRIPIGASDFIAGAAFTFDDMPSGQTDERLTHFSTAPDEQTLQPLLRQALQLNPKLKIVASPWSPPAWMKTTGTLTGGALRDDPAVYRAYADYLVRFVENYQQAGIPIWALTVQNEPQQRRPDGYPGTDMPVSQEATLIQALGPALRQAGLPTAILGYDHNWSLHPADAATTPTGQDPAYQYPADLLRSAAAPWLAGTAYHCYSGTADQQAALHAQFSTKAIWVTECSGSHAPTDSTATTFANTLTWQANNLLIAATRNWAQAALTFNLALNPDGGPHTGGCATCTAIITVLPGGRLDRNAEYYLLAHAGRFLTPGAVRIESESPTTLPISHVAFRNPDRSLVLIAYNNADHATQLTINTGTIVLATTAPRQSLITVIWHQ